MATKNQKTSAALEKKVRAAIPELEKDGIRLTNANVREKIGGGSFRDIGPILKAYLAEQSAREKAETRVPEMPEDVADLATALWESAYRQADEANATDRRARAEEIKALRDELSDKDEEVAIVEDERDEALARAEEAEVQVAEQTLAIQALKIQIAGLEGRLLGRSEAETASDPTEDDTGASEGTEEEHQLDMFKISDPFAGPQRPAA